MSTDYRVRLRRFIVSRRTYAKSGDFARREDFPNARFPRQTKRRQKDAKIPDSCFVSSQRKMSILFLGAIRSPFLD